MKFKKVVVELTQECAVVSNPNCTEIFENVEWNNSEFGVSISPKEGEFIFYPLERVLKIHAMVD